jgi:NAD(P)-dependent dehydrogenase (short-subunit alcohol dehydrogenase family)
MDLGLSGKNVLLFGGNATIGYATSLSFAKEGANLVIASRDVVASQKVADKAKKRITKFVSDYMARYGYKRVQDLQGHALQYIKPWPEIAEQARQLKLVANVDLSKCTGCGIWPTTYVMQSI